MLGKRITEENDNFERFKIYGNQIVQRVAKSLNKSPRTIAYAIQFYRQYSDLDLLPEGKNISWSKIVKKYLSQLTAEEIAEIESKKLPSNIQLLDGDFKQAQIDPESVDLILTDPPYGHEYLSLWDDLGAFADKVLKPGGYLVAYSGHCYLQEAMFSLSEHLKYFWIFCLSLPGSTRLLSHQMVMVGWRPVIVFHKPPFKRSPFAMYDVINSPREEKELHEWQQSEGGVKKFLEYFSREGNLVVDPFSGSGTFAKVAHEMGRSAIGIEIDKNSNLKAKKRILSIVQNHQEVSCSTEDNLSEKEPSKIEDREILNIDNGRSC